MKLALGITFVLLGPLVFIRLLSRDSNTLYFEGLERSEYLPLGMGVAMLAGIVFGTLYQGLIDRQDDISIAGELRAILRKPHLWRALLAAPIVFLGVYAAAREHADVLVAAVFAFQNGFFCEAILRKSTRTQG